MCEYTAKGTRKYTTAISKGAGMVNETRKLLEHWIPGETIDAFAKRVQTNGLLGNATAYRTRDVVKRVFAPRFLRPNDKPARILRKIIEKGLPGRPFTEMLLVFTARWDPLVHDFIRCEYWPAARKGTRVLDTELFLAFLSQAVMDSRLESEWSENVSVRIGRCVLGLLRDIGFLREVRRGRKEVVDYRMSDGGVAILAKELSESGVTDSTLCSHPDWMLFGMRETEVLERLDAFGEHRGVIVQRAGSVVRLTWYVETVEEIIDVFAGQGI